MPSLTDIPFLQLLLFWNQIGYPKKNFNINNFRSYFSTLLYTDWIPTYELADVDSAVNLLSDTLYNISETDFPVK